jgi:ribosomal protein L37AE/L43A
MNKEEIVCPSCEAESYIESDNEIYFCPHCGSDIADDDDYDWDEEEPNGLDEDI